MERVAFLIEETNERLSCLLNPESLVTRRVAGVRPRGSVSGQLTGLGLADDPLLYTGGGSTQLDLDLLFDVTLAGSSIASEDVRDLTRPLWRLAENAMDDEGYGQLPLARFIWGRSWNMLGAVVAVAERLEYFTPEGVPRRSWLSMRMLRVNETSAQGATEPPAPPPEDFAMEGVEVPEESVRVHEVIGGVPEDVSLASGEETPIDEATMTAAGIASSALAETRAGALLSSAERGISAAADEVRSDLADLIAAIGETPAVQAIRSGIDTVSSTLRAMAAASKARIVEAMNAAASEISAAAEKVTTALKGLVSEVVQPIVAKVKSALERVASGIKAIRTAAETVANAVKDKVGQIVTAALDKLGSAISKIRDTMERVSTAASAFATRAAEMVRSAMLTLGSAMERIRSTGEMAAIALINDALNGINSAIELLWSAGETLAVRAIGAATKTICFAFKLLTAAAESVTSLSETGTADIILSAVTRIRSAVATMRLPEGIVAAEEDLDPVRQDLATIEETVASSELARRSMAPEAISPALHELRSALESPFPERESVVDRSLETITAAAKAIEAQEEAEIGQIVRSALVGEMHPAETASGGEAARGTEAGSARTTEIGIGLGERLDQIAFRVYGNPAFWRLLAVFNDIDNPLHLSPGRPLRMPPASVLDGR